MKQTRDKAAPALDLFGADDVPSTQDHARDAAGSGTRPLADRLRPATLDEVVGQPHLLGPDGALRRMLERGSLASLILWGGPGVGKTTIARLLAQAAGLRFTQLSAVFSGVADLKRAFDEASRRLQASGEATLLFVDEIHRFNRAQQDGFLPVVENGTVVLVGATTENPSFVLNAALLSRCQVMVLRHDNHTIGLLVDDLHAVPQFNQSQIIRTPLLANGESMLVTEVIKANHGHLLIQAVDVGRLFAWLIDGIPPAPESAMGALSAVA